MLGLLSSLGGLKSNPLRRKSENINFGESDSMSSAKEDLKGTQYEDLLNSNPYENMDYQNGIWDSLGDFFGFRTGQDKLREDLSLRSSEFISQVMSLKREEEYNSEAAKVARMKAAGLNPDLQGLGDASQASEFSEPENSPESNDGSEGLRAVQTAASLVFSGLDMATGLFTTLSKLKGLNIANSSSELSLTSSMRDFALNSVLDAIDPRGFGYEYDKGDGNYIFDSKTPFDELVSLYGKENVRMHNPVDFDKLNRVSFSKKSDNALWKRTIAQVLGGLPQDVSQYKSWYDREFARRGYAEKRASSYFSDDDSEMMVLLEPFIQAIDAFNMIDVQADTSKRSNDVVYESAFDAQGLAIAENAENQAVGNAKSADAQIESVWKDITDKLYTLKDKHPVAASVGLLVIGYLRMQSKTQHTISRYDSSHSGYGTSKNGAWEKSGGASGSTYTF